MAGAALAVLVASIAAGSSLISKPPSITTHARDKRGATGATVTPTPAVSPPPRPAPTRPAGFVTFDDPKAGFSIAYPSTWKRLNAPDKEIRLLIADGTRASLLIRVAPVGLTVTRGTLGIVRKLTDSLVFADRSVKLLSQPEAITLDGLPGYRYLYTFGAGSARRRGAHVHYFVFRDKRLITLVFQVPGVGALKRDLGTLDRLVGTFHVAP